MSLARRVRKREGRFGAACPCQTRRIRIIHCDEPDDSPTDDGLKDGGCVRCGRIPPPSVVCYVHTERDWSSDSTQEPLEEE
jgi:hypothetical protein